jgi:uncharacterized protein (DUF2236 family)
MTSFLDELLREFVAPPPGAPAVDFTAPIGAPGLFAPSSVTWRIMKNPVALLVGGVAAVILELAEPHVRTGVWEHTRFREDPVGRIRRTGYAALVTTYAPAEQARALIARVGAVHARVSGVTPAGAPYRADDPELLSWVYATAQFGFLEAYHRHARRLSDAERDQFYAEGVPVAALWGARDAPISRASADDLFQRMRPRLEGSGIVFEFLDIMRGADLAPALARPLQTLAVSAAVDIIPQWARKILGLDQRFGMPFGGASLLRALGVLGECFTPEIAPWAQARVRLQGLGR